MSSIPVGVQIGVETTTIVKALARAAMRVGGVEMSEAVRRSGSDPSTEQQLIEILGRNRLDPAISVHFRSITARSSQQEISHFMKGLVLESGAGPTLSQALACDDPALLSAVVQVSFLAWFHDAESLAQAFTQAMEDELVEGKATAIFGLNYISLLGTIRACQQQTVAFSWERYYSFVEQKISGKLQRTPSSESQSRKRRKTQGAHRSAQPESEPLKTSDRAVPYIILRALVRSVTAVQRFPEEHVLQITCDQGISSIVVWCYYILDISVLVLVDDKRITFGDEPYRVTIARCRSKLEVGACLLEAKAEIVPVFNLVSSDLDPCLSGDYRVHARGFLKTLMNSRGVTDGDIADLARSLLSDCLSDLRAMSSHNRGPRAEICRIRDCWDQDCPSSSLTDGVIELASMNHVLRAEIRPAIAFLFDIDPGELLRPTSSLHGALWQTARVSWTSMSWLAYSFARVKDRESCDSIPISFEQFDRIEAADNTLLNGNGSRRLIPDTIACFETLCRMLLGARYTPQYISKAFLVSERGWSIFLSSLEATDPEDFDCGVIHIKPGVPARDGARRARIIDGMTDFNINLANTVTFTEELEEISFWPGMCSAKLVGTSIGYDGLDAFVVVQRYDWAHTLNGRSCRKWGLGFREKQILCMDSWILKRCSCGIEFSEKTAKKSVDDLHMPLGRATRGSNPTTTYTRRFPDKSSLGTATPERVLQHDNTWLFFVTGDGAARWLAMDNFKSLDKQGRSGFPRYIRGRHCCVRCAANFAKSEALVLL